MNKFRDNNRFYLSRKLIGIVTFFLIAASVLVVLTNFTLNIIAATGNYIAILSAHSQQQQQSVILFERYIRNNDQADYQEYLESKNQLQKQNRVIDELFKPDPDLKIIFDLLSSENMYPNEISSLVYAFEKFRESERVQNLNNQWERLNNIETERDEITQLINQEWNSERADQSQINLYFGTLRNLNEDWNNVNKQLMANVSGALGFIKRAGLWISVILGILLVLIGVVVTVRANKSISRWEQILNEKQVLLSEIHHRVKNNLAVISGLLELESMQNNGEHILQNSKNRIQSMALIHEVLYQSDSFSRINMSNYLQKLIKYIKDAHDCEKKNINLHSRLEDVILNINQAVPVGLIVSEVLATIIDRKFYDNDKDVEILLKESDGQISLSIRGNGKRQPKDLDDTKPLGLIAETLVQQLNAELIYKKNGKGAAVNLQFKKTDASGSSSAKL